MALLRARGEAKAGDRRRRLHLRRRPHAARPRQGRRLAARGDGAQSREPGARRDQGPQRARSGADRRRGAGLRRSGRRGRRRHRPRRRDHGGLRQRGAGHADQPLLRLRPRRGELRRGRGHVRPARHDDRRRRRIHEPRRHRRLRRRLAGRSVDRAEVLFRAAGHFRRPDRDQIRLLARRRRRLRGREPEARGEVLGGRPLQEFGDRGEGRQRADAARQGRAHAADHDDADPGAAQSVVRADGRHGGLRRGRDPALSRDRGDQPRPHAGQFVRHRRRRRGRADRQQERRHGGGVEAARAHPAVRQHRLRALDHADRPGAGDREGAEEGRHEDQATSTCSS